MLDELLIAQASLNTLQVLTNISLVSAALLVLGGAGLLLTHGAAGGLKAATRVLSKLVFAGGALGMTALVVVIMLALIPRRPERYVWTVDLRSAATFSPFERERCSTWEIGARAYRDCIYEGETQLTAQFPADRTIVQTGRVLWASGRDDRLISLHHFLEPMVYAEVRAIVEPLIDPWRLRRDHYEYWLTNAATEERASYLTPADEDRTEPWLELSVRPLDTRRDGERVYAVSLKWHWNED